MKNMQRYAVYYAPRPGAFADAAAAWLGWDTLRGCAVGHAQVGLPLAELTAEPRRYGFHGTLRAPFRLAEGMGRAEAEGSIQALAKRLVPVVCGGLRLENLNGFLALTPIGCEAALLELGAEVVTATDPLRAPLTAPEIARRRPESLSSRQRDLLEAWGYPFVMEEFRFHLTLTERLAGDRIETVQTAIRAHFDGTLPAPFIIEDLCFFGQDSNGVFHLLQRYPLLG